MNLSLPKYAGRYGKTSQLKFYGYDRLGTEGAIRDMENMTCDYWPELAVRPKRYTLGGLYEFCGMFSHGGTLGYADGGRLYFGGVQYGGDDLLTLDNKAFVSIGDYVVIWPDKVWFDTVSGETGTLEATVTPTGAGFGSWTAPSGISTAENALAVDTALTGQTLSVFKAGDAVTISGCEKHPENNKTLVVREIMGNVMYFTDYSFTLDERYVYTVPEEGLAAGAWDFLMDGGSYHFMLPEALVSGDVIRWQEGKVTAAKADGTETVLYSSPGYSGYNQSIEFGALESLEYEETGTVTIRRTVPDLDFVIEHGNRLMGCKDDTIYISAAGDMFNWNIFDGTAADSFSTDTGTSGRFTGAVSYYGYPRFFKEDYIFTLYGDYPAEYELQKYEVHGVMEGSGRSLAVVNGRLFYLSRYGPQVYTGSVPSRIGDAFGVDRYVDGVGGSDGLKYYLSMVNAADRQNHLFVYDTEKGLWMREDDLRVRWFTRTTELYYMSWSGSMGILGRALEAPEGAEEEGPVKWFVEFGDITEEGPDRKLVNKLQLRLEMEDDACVTVKMLFDSADTWTTVGSVAGGKKRSVTLPIIPRRLDHFRLRVEGEGMVRIGSITRQFASASER